MYFLSSCANITNQSHIFSLIINGGATSRTAKFNFVLSPTQKTEHMKRENHSNEEIHQLATRSQKPHSSRASNPKKRKVCSFAETMMPRKRKIAGKNKQAVDDLFTFDLELPNFKARENSDLLERSAKEVSTKLVVYDDTWSTKDNEPYVRRTNMKEKVLTYNIGLMKNYMPGEEEEEERIGVSTKLKLFSYPWKITKTLTISDVGHMSRLLVSINSVERYVLPFLDVELISEVHSKKGLTVNVWDQDTNSTHGLFFKKWVSMNCFVFNGKWNQNFVHRRNLRAGDKIGLYWDSFYSRLSFCVLDRAAPTIQEAPALE